MSRTEKLYRRLNELETEYVGLIGRELQEYIDKGYSDVLSSVLKPILHKYGPADQVGHIDWLAKEITALREKLGESLTEGPVADIASLSKKVTPRYYSDAEIRPLLTAIVKQWKADDLKTIT